MNKINIALVGCGRISGKHFEAILNNADDFCLTAVCDSDPMMAEEKGTQYHVPYFTDIETMLEKVPSIELVSLCTPSGLHPAHSMICSAHQKHVMTEKPMGCRVSEAIAMIEAAKQKDKRLFVVKQNRLNPTVQALKAAIEAGDFGKIYLAHINVFWTRPQAYYDQAAWRGTWEYDGGAFMNQASHYVDLLEYLMGGVESVQAMTKTLARNIEAEDTGVVNFSWKNGAVGSMAVTMLTYPKNLEGSITIIGEKGTARIDGVALNEIKHWFFEKSSVSHSADLNYMPENVYGNGHTPYYKNVADVLLRDAAPVSDGESGLKSLKLLSAIYEAARTGNTIFVEN